MSYVKNFDHYAYRVPSSDSRIVVLKFEGTLEGGGRTPKALKLKTIPNKWKKPF